MSKRVPTPSPKVGMQGLSTFEGDQVSRISGVMVMVIGSVFGHVRE